MPQLRRLAALALLLVPGALATGACAVDDPGHEPLAATKRAKVSRSTRRERAGLIRDAAAAKGITQGWLIAGIANGEVNLAHCWSEATWACKGLNSPDCGGGPVVAGSADGPCADRQGGLGIFQFDGGTFDQTIARDGEGVLHVDQSADLAVEFMIDKVIKSTYIDGVSTREEAIEWMNGVRPDNARFETWIKTVTHYYNGCKPSYGCYTQRFGHYRDNALEIFFEVGEDFWDVDGTGGSPQAPTESPRPQPRPEPEETRSCAQIAEARGWQNFACEAGGNDACSGRGVKSGDCDVCCGSTCSYSDECPGSEVCAWSGAEYCCQTGGTSGETCFTDADCGGGVCTWNGEGFVCAASPTCNDLGSDSGTSGVQPVMSDAEVAPPPERDPATDTAAGTGDGPVQVETITPGGADGGSTGGDQPECSVGAVGQGGPAGAAWMGLGALGALALLRRRRAR